MGRVMPHPAEPAPGQAGTIAQLRRLVKLWLEDTTEAVEVKNWIELADAVDPALRWSCASAHP